MKDILLRVLVGGLAVSAFALLGDLLRPKSFAGLLAAAPSVALATLTLTAMTQGNGYVSIEARSMILGAVAYIVYATVVSHSLICHRFAVLPVSTAALLLWFVIASGLWFAMKRIVG